MKTLFTVMAAALVACLVVVALQTQRSAQAQNTASAKVVVVDIEMFSDSTKGIRRLVEKYSLLDREFKPRRDEIAEMTARYDKLTKEIRDTQAVAAPDDLSRRLAEAETLKRSIERKREDGQRDLDRRVKELTEPIYTQLNTALQAFARERNIDIILDMSKLSGSALVVNQQVDITDSFIADFNSKNPVTP